MTELLDSTFIDPTNAGVAGSTPRSVTYGAPSVASTGDLADDCEEAIGIRAGGRGVGADVGARGGVMAGLPVIVSESCAHDSDAGNIALVDGAGSG